MISYWDFNFIYMKKFIILAAVCLSAVVSASAQNVTDSLSTDTVLVAPEMVVASPDTVVVMPAEVPVVAPEVVAAPVPVVKYGYLSYSQVLENMSDYKMAQQQLKDLRAKYEMEAQYNEASFKRQFAEYLQGQKDFPQSIMLKRQRDLQEALEKSLAFREEATRLLKQAEVETLAPIKARLDNAIRVVGGLYELDYVYNLDTNAMPYVNPALVMDVTQLVQQELLK